MDDRKVGLVIRALRRQRGWRQADLAHRAGVSQTLGSLIERGHVAGVSFRRLRQVCLGLEAAVSVEVRWRGGQADRLLDNDHARLVAQMIAALTALGWTVRAEVTYAEYAERGSFDILGWHPESRSLLIIEVKTELLSAEATLRKLDEKVRLGPLVARRRFGWIPASTSRLLVLPESTTTRRRLAQHRGLFEAALPAAGRIVRHWIAAPTGLSGRILLPPSTTRAGKRSGGGRHRVRTQPKTV
jgi:transcriptional regulator with XRE-family HTH domain